MKVSVILGHPYEGSFNSAIAEKVVEALRENGHVVMFHDLYRENFNPVIPKEELVSNQTKDSLVELHQQEIREALNRLWKDCIFDFCGVPVFDRIMFRVVADSNCTEREEWLNQTKNMVKHNFP